MLFLIFIDVYLELNNWNFAGYKNNNIGFALTEGRGKDP
jgi:hypothetical protein